MKKLTITTSRAAAQAQVQSLFTPVNGGTLTRERYDRGKYNADAKLVGREIEAPDTVHAVWPERRKDSHGPYLALFCLSSRV